jgi:ubiquinone/menaquinone biosynthesis C-methylase UbiE
MIRIIQTRKGAQTAIVIILALLACLLLVFIYPQISFVNHKKQPSPEIVKISTSSSLIHVGSNDSFAITEDGKQAARYVLEFLKTKNPQAGEAAISLYNKLIPRENYGGEYSALKWFCEYLLASDAEKQKFLENRYVASFFQFFADNDFANLKEYVARKYRLVTFEDQYTELGQNRHAFLEDFILFNNPRREDWEKTSKVIESLQLKPGETIADVGSGPGYYSFQFADLVGEKGKIYAIDTVSEHLNYVKQVSDKYDIKNIETVHTPGDTIGVPENVADRVFLCSLYHNIYGMNKEDERDRFVASIYKSLKKNGKLIVVDNAMVKTTEMPYHGPYIAKELIIGQMKYYGFKLVDNYAFIPQRYVLVFEKA